MRGDWHRRGSQPRLLALLVLTPLLAWTAIGGLGQGLALRLVLAALAVLALLALLREFEGRTPGSAAESVPPAARRTGYMPSVRLASAVFVAANAGFAFLAYREYRSVAAYCDGSPEVEAGGGRYSCLEPQHWFAITGEIGILLFLETVLLVVVGAAVVHRQKRLARRFDEVV